MMKVDTRPVEIANFGPAGPDGFGVLRVLAWCSSEAISLAMYDPAFGHMAS